MVLERSELRGLELRKENVEPLLDMFKNGDTRWYALRRARGFARAGLLAGSYWNPDLHPRGPDGRFIEKWGFVRWLLDGLWVRGQVENLLPDNQIIVAPDNDPSNPVVLNVNQAYALPTPKGKLVNNPDPAGYEDQDLGPWEKTGGQGGSNPGAMYTTTETVPVVGEVNEDMVEKAAANHGLYEVTDYKDLSDSEKAAYGPMEDVVATWTDNLGKRHVFYGGQPGNQQVNWGPVGQQPDFRVWGTPDAADVSAVKLELTHGLNVPEGTEFYIKQTKTPNHAANEMLANEFYKLAGVPVPDLYFGEHGTVASKIAKNADGSSGTMLSSLKDDPDVLRQMRENMAVDAWLANWDVAGMTYDNVIVVDGIAVRIDTGGSLQYRAKGGEKFGQFGDKVGELTTYLDPSTNPSASHVFKGVSQAEIQKGATKVAAISEDTIHRMVDNVGLSSTVADTLIARRKDLINQAGIPDPYVGYAPPKLHSIIKSPKNPEMFWNPIADEWQSGVLKKTALMTQEAVDAELFNMWKAGSASELPLVGETAVARLHVGYGFIRVTEIDEGTATWRGVSALDPDNPTLYSVGSHQIRAAEATDALNQAYLQYEVAQANEAMKLWNVDSVATAIINSTGMDRHPIHLTPRGTVGTATDLWELETDDFVIERYGALDHEGSFQNYTVLYRVNGKTDDSMSLTNVIDGKERIVAKDEDVASFPVGTVHKGWLLPNDYTQDLFLGMLKRDGLIDQDDIVELEIDPVPETFDGEGIPAPTAFNTTPVSMEHLGVIESLTDENGFNSQLALAEVQTQAEFFDGLLAWLDENVTATGEAQVIEDTPWHEWVGQTIILGSKEPSDSWKSKGVHFVTKAEVVVRDVDGQQVVNASLIIRDPFGDVGTWQFGTSPGQEPKEGHMIALATGLDASVAHKPVTLKATGEIVHGGKVVGTYNKKHAYPYGYEAKLYPEFTASGTAVDVATTQYNAAKRHLKTAVEPHLLPQLKPTMVEKTIAVDGAFEKIMAAATFKTRADYTTGSWVGAPDGFIGKVSEQKLDAFPSAVVVESEDFLEKRIYNANLLIDFGSEPPAPTALTPVESLDKIPADAPYWPQKYGDGNDPRLGQVVRAQRGSNVTEGVVEWVTPPHGKQTKVTPYAIIRDAEGKKWKKALSTITVLSEPAVGSYPPDKGLPESEKATIELAMDFTPEQISDFGMKHVSDDGKLLLQPEWEKEQWLAGSSYRKLMKDGYAPRVGMRVRNSKDEAGVILAFKDQYTQPDKVVFYNFATGKTVQSQFVSTLTVDHAAELTTAGASLDYIAGITNSGAPTSRLPDGTVIYKATSYQSQKMGDLYRNVDLYFYIDQHGRVTTLGTNKIPSYQQESFIRQIAGQSDMLKVAVIDSKSPLYGAYGDWASTEKPTTLEIYDPAEMGHEEALSNYFVSLTSAKVEGTEVPPGIPTSNLIPLPKPADAIDFSDDEIYPNPPPITGTLGEIDEVPTSLPVRSVLDAALKATQYKDSDARGTGTYYAFGDQGYVEDMMVRSQIAKDVSDGNREYVEVFFRLNEAINESTADKLTVVGQDVEYGKWVARPDTVYASALKKGDAIIVRKSSMSDMLKPAKGTTPNVRVVADPVLIGNDAKGTPIYRVAVASADGVTGAVDIEERSMPSLTVFDWDSHAIASTGKTHVKLTDKATQAGWMDIGDIGYDFSTTHGKEKSRDSTGAKLFTGTSVMPVGGDPSYGSTAELVKAKRAQRGLGDGAYVRVNLVPSSVSGTGAGSGGSGSGEIRRWNEAGLVTIRVPIEIAENDPEKLQSLISQGMEAVGIPPEAQAPATDADIARFALNKLYKTHSPVFTHREAGVDEANPNNAGVVKVLDRMNKELQMILGRPVTLDDVEISITEEGRLVVLLSDEVAQAITTKQGNYYYNHGGSGAEDLVLDQLSGPSMGLMGGVERYGIGTLKRGKSTETDHTKGSGNRVYLTGIGDNRWGTYSSATGVWVFSATAINKSLDVYMNGSDGFGHRSQTNATINQGEGHEYMVKGKLDPAQLAYFIISTEVRRKDLIEKLKARGVSEINGRPIEDIIVTTTTQQLGKGTLKDEEFQKLGTDYGDTIKLSDLLAKLGIGGIGVEQQPVAATPEAEAASEVFV